MGGLIHAFFGVFFGECYAFILMGIDHGGVGANLLIGGGSGHVSRDDRMSMVLIAASVAEVHPLEQIPATQFCGVAVVLGGACGPWCRCSGGRDWRIRAGGSAFVMERGLSGAQMSE